MALTNAEIVTQLYVGYYNRAPDPEGLSYWIGRLNAGVSQADVANSFATSPEAIAKYPFFAFPELTNAESFLTSVYQNLFGRAIDADGLAYYSGQLSSGNTPVGQILAEIIGNAATNEGSADQKYLANKVTVGLDFAVSAANVPGFTYNTAAAAAAADVLSGVNATDASVTAAEAKTDAFLANAANPGITVPFTKGVDALIGTNGNDTFVADNTQTDKVIGPADTVNGGAGTDTLKIFSASADAVDAITLPTLTSVEKIVFNGGTLTNTKSVNVSAVAGVESVEIVSPAAVGAAFTVKTSAAQSVALTSVTAAANYAIALDGAVKATLNGVTATGGGVATLDIASNTATFNVAATGAASTITLTNSAAGVKTEKLVVTGDKAITITEALTTLKTVDASANTAGVTLNVGSTAVDLAFTGGAGKDKVIIAGAQFTAKDTLIGGEGKDTIQLSDNTVAYAGINKAAGFEVLALGATGATVDIAQITNGINEFAVANTGSTTFTNALSSSVFTVDNTAGVTAVSIANKVGETATSVSIDNQAGSAQTLATLTLSGATNVALESTGKALSSNVITTFNNADNSNITVKGATDLKFALSATVTGSKVDASAFTGKLDITGSSKADVIIGGSGDDTITGGAGNDTLTGGAGKDTFKIDNVTAAGIDTITDFAAGTDKIQFVAATAITDKGTLSSVTFADFDAALASFASGGANATTATAGGVYVFTYGTDKYALIEDGSNAGYLAGEDAVVKITGHTGTLALTDFIA